LAADRALLNTGTASAVPFGDVVNFRAASGPLTVKPAVPAERRVKRKVQALEPSKPCVPFTASAMLAAHAARKQPRSISGRVDRVAENAEARQLAEAPSQSRAVLNENSAVATAARLIAEQGPRALQCPGAPNAEQRVQAAAAPAASPAVPDGWGAQRPMRSARQRAQAWPGLGELADNLPTL
jgi:hypothetical protein